MIVFHNVAATNNTAVDSFYVMQLKCISYLKVNNSSIASLTIFYPLLYNIKTQEKQSVPTLLYENHNLLHLLHNSCLLVILIS